MSAMGLTPDYVRELDEYKNIKRIVDASFAYQRKYTAFMVKNFKKEMQKDRTARLTAKIAANSYK